MRGLFIQENCDRRRADEGFAFIEEFLSEQGETSHADEAGLQLKLPIWELFGAYYQLGARLFSQGASSAFRRHMQVLSDVGNDGVLLCKIALCRGLYVHQGEVLEPIIAADFEFVQRFLHKRHAFSPVEPRNERDRTPFCSEQSDLEAITSYAQSEKLKTFFIDETPPAEYQIDVAAGPTTCRKTGRIGTSMIDRRGRPRIMLPFTPFGQMICTRPESPNGIYWCFDLLRSGYSSVHELTLSGPRKTSVTRQLTRNLLGRMGLNYLLPTNSSAPSPHSALERLVRSCSPTYGPIPGRILMVTSTFALGGSERQAIAVASALMRRGYDVRLMALGPL